MTLVWAPGLVTVIPAGGGLVPEPEPVNAAVPFGVPRPVGPSQPAPAAHPGGPHAPLLPLVTSNSAAGLAYG